MKRAIKSVIINCFIVIIACTCGGCIPFIDGAIEAKDYFEEAVQCKTYLLNPSAVNGFDTVDSDNLSLSALTDGDEKNTVMQHYYSFTFKVQNKDFTLQAVAFIVEVQEAVTISFQLTNGSTNSKQSIELMPGRTGTVEFTELNIDIAASSELTITLANPLDANVPYRIDTVLFVI